MGVARGACHTLFLVLKADEGRRGSNRLQRQLGVRRNTGYRSPPAGPVRFSGSCRYKAAASKESEALARSASRRLRVVAHVRGAADIAKARKADLSVALDSSLRSCKKTKTRRFDIN